MVQINKIKRKVNLIIIMYIINYSNNNIKYKKELNIIKKMML